MRIVRRDWTTDIDTRELRLTERQTIGWINRRRLAQRRRRRLLDKLRALWRCERSESARPIAGGKRGRATDG